MSEERSIHKRKIRQTAYLEDFEKSPESIPPSESAITAKPPSAEEMESAVPTAIPLAAPPKEPNEKESERTKKAETILPIEIIPIVILESEIKKRAAQTESATILCALQSPFFFPSEKSSLTKYVAAPNITHSDKRSRTS